jgi:methylene-fatty-acyl-phospholipid synthase
LTGFALTLRGFFVVAAVLLSIERVCYAWVWRRPDAFRAFCARTRLTGTRDPVQALERLFGGFKVLQLGVFATWCALAGGPTFGGGSRAAIAFGIAALAGGQILNAAVFVRLGRDGVFYGNRFGKRLPWHTGFPFSTLRHPQYVGSAVSIWGLFAVLRYPHPDWLVLPILQTVYYAAATRLEGGRSVTAS